MGFAGNLRTLALPEVLQTLNRIKATGVLRLAAPEGGRDVIFDQGELIGVSFRRGEERQALLRRLILEGRLDATTAAQISSSGRESQVIGRLIEGGVIDEAAVKDATQRQAEEELQSLFTWDYADFVFHDATPEAEDITALVERTRADGLVFNINSLLMESARRQDEWERVRQTFPDGGLVLGPREGMEAGLQEAAKEYPGSAVIPLVDAVRSLDDLVKDSVVTRLDAWSCLAALLERGLVVPLTRDDIIYHGDYLVSKNDLLRACSLYRRALAARPADSETAKKLADCLARLGDAPEAAASFAQLAIGCLNAQDGAAAVGHARKAVQLAPEDPALRQTLVRCLLAQDPKANANEAVGELLQLVETYTGLDRLEDARSTCLKVLELDKGNEPARRQLARIFSAAAHDEQSEDVVVCVQCGHVNHREAAECEKCKASLQLTCLACGRPVGVSDRLCIFCGADPHRGSQNRRAGGSPATSRLVNPAKVRAGAIAGGIQAVTDQLDAMVAAAHAKEEAEDWEGALEQWREISKVQVDSPDIISHIRRLETLVHDSFIEKQIEQGHQFRRVRRYWAAIKCYKAALRTMPSDDPRAERLVEILASTTKVGQRIALLYAAAILVILLGAGIAIMPWLKQRGFDGEVAALRDRLDQAGGQGAQLAPLRPEIDDLVQRIEDLGGDKRWVRLRIAAQELRGAHIIAWEQAGERELEPIEMALKQGDIAGARSRLAGYKALFFENRARIEAMQARVDKAQKQQDERVAQIKNAPALLAAAEKAEAEGRLGEALGSYRELSASPSDEVKAKAKDAAARLAPRAETVNASVQAAIDESRRLQDESLVKAEERLGVIAAEAAQWNLASIVEERRREVRQQLERARTDAARLGVDATVEQIDAFLAAHPGSPDAPRIRQRRDRLVSDQAALTQARARFEEHLAAQRYEQAWTAGRDLVAGYGARAGDIRLPLWIETAPSGAEVTLDGRPVGRSPCLLRYAPGQKGEVRLTVADCQPVVRRLEELTATWRWTPQLTRQIAWSTALGRPVTALAVLPDGGVVVSTTEGLARLAADGKVRWKVGLAADAMRANARIDQATLLPGGRLAVAKPGSGVALVDERGGILPLATQGEVRGRPVGYINEVLGATPRVAFAAEALYSGEPGGTMTRIALPAPAISGPVAVVKDIDRLLVIADTRGRLVGVEESTRTVQWEADAQAADVGQLIALGDSDAVAVLDGGRLACFTFTPRGASPRWTQQLEGPAVGDPVVADGVVYAASGTQIVRVGAEGSVRPALVLSASASAAMAVAGPLVAAASTDGLLHLFHDGTLRWSSPLPAPATALALDGRTVIAALADGSVLAFRP